MGAFLFFFREECETAVSAVLLISSSIVTFAIILHQVHHDIFGRHPIRLYID